MASASDLIKKLPALTINIVLPFILVIYGLNTKGSPDFQSLHRPLINVTIFSLTLLQLWRFLLTYGPSFTKQSLTLRGKELLPLSGLALLSAMSFYQFGKFHGPNFVHYWEQTHYYLGSKYFPELSYKNLYKAMIQAQKETTGSYQTEIFRDLNSKELVPLGEHLKAVRETRKNFSNARWAEFKRDVSGFRSRFSQKRWNQLLLDHGYNPPPGWTVLGRSLIHTLDQFPLSLDQKLTALALIDPALLFIVFIAIAFCLGPFTGLISIIFYFATPFQIFDFTGGSFLRQAWFFTSMLGFCFVSIKKPVMAGFFFGLSISFRIFPVLFLLFPFLQFFWLWMKDKSLPIFHLLLGISTFLSLAIAVGLSSLSLGFEESWLQFFQNILQHENGVYTNHISFRNAFIYEPGHTGLAYREIGDNYHEYWRHHKEERFAMLRPLYLLMSCLLILKGFSVFKDRSLTSGLNYFCFLPFLILYPANYYIMFILPVVFLHRKNLVFLMIIFGSLASLYLLGMAVSGVETLSTFSGFLILMWFLLPLGWRKSENLSA